MLPVSAWPPGPPGASLSPFGLPRQVSIGSNGFVIPKGAWIVSTTSNSVVMFFPPVQSYNPARTPGTGLLSQAPQQQACGCPPPGPKQFPRYDDALEGFRAWQRKTGDAGPPIYPFAGRRPPNWFGWTFVPAPFSTLVPPGSTGTLVIADGQNVVITGSGCATITQAYSV
jgi:hypothetical protein